MANAITIGHREVVIVPDGSTNFDITTIQNSKLPMGTVTGDFTVGETVTQAGSSATGVVYAWDAVAKTLHLVSMTGTFNITGQVTGGSSGATGTPKEVMTAFPNGLRLSAIDFRPSANNDKLVVRQKTAYGATLFSRIDTTGGGIHQAVGGRSLRTKPYIVASECTFSTPGSTMIRLEFD